MGMNVLPSLPYSPMMLVSSEDDRFICITGIYRGFSLEYLDHGFLILTLQSKHNCNDDDDNDNKIYSVKLNVSPVSTKLQYARCQNDSTPPNIFHYSDYVSNSDFHPVTDFTLI